MVDIFISSGLISHLNGTTADEHSPKPIQQPQTRGSDDLLRLYPNEASRDSDSQNYDQPNQERPTSRHNLQEQTSGNHFNLLR
jgi:hypothetical protein